MFRTLNIETSSYCNRRCVSCLRQTEPDREGVSSMFAQHLMSPETVCSVMDQAIEMGFRGAVCLSFYNEPTLDRRLPDYGGYAKRAGFYPVYFHTNGDFLTPDVAERLDGNFDRIRVSLYDKGPQEHRKQELSGMFTRTSIKFGTGLHWATHNYMPGKDLSKIIDLPCHHVARNMVINHKGDVLACCDEVTPHFGLGSVLETTLSELWQRKQELVRTLRQHGGRRQHAYCSTCPRHSGMKTEYVVEGE